MLKRLIIHTGAPKTGSSAIQKFLADNRSVLLRRGFIVPNVNLGLQGEVEGHQVWFFDKASLNIDSYIPMFEKSIETINCLDDRDYSLIISAENLHDMKGVEKMFKNIVDRYPTQVILYIRRQDDDLSSSWKQWYSKISPDYWAWLISSIPTIGNWRHSLQTWANIIDKDNIVVRIYEKEHLYSGDVVKDFLHLLGETGNLDTFSFNNGIINPSFNEATTSLLNDARMIFRDSHDTKFTDMILNATGELLVSKVRESILSYEQRAAIVWAYNNDNEWVRKNYFPSKIGSLFRSVYDDKYVIKQKDTITSEKFGVLLALIKILYEGRSESAD